MKQHMWCPQVLPGAFLVTAPHPRAPTWRAAPGTAADQQQLARVKQVYTTFKQRLARQLPGCELPL